MGALIDLTGRTFGRLHVLKLVGTKPCRWLCRCQCKTKKVVRGKELRTGDTVSCGCYMRERVSARRTVHGHNTSNKRRSPTYNTWRSMLQRCTNKDDKSYKYYGGRGITVCKRWMKFENFLVDMGQRPVGRTLERKKNQLGYSLSNCYWATWAQQQANKRAWGTA